MNKNVFFAVSVVIIIVIGGYFLLNGPSDQPMPAKESGEKVGTEDINIGVGELQEDSESMMEEDRMTASDDAMMEDEGAMSGDSMKMEDDSMAEDGVMMEDDTTMDSGMMEKDGAAMNDDILMESSTRPGTVEDYDPSKLVLAEDGDVVMYFYANWCPTCKALDKDIEANLDSIPDNTHILRVNYDTEAELKRKYGVTYQHTFVQVDADGELVKKWSGSPTLSSLVSQIQ